MTLFIDMLITSYYTEKMEIDFSDIATDCNDKKACFDRYKNIYQQSRVEKPEDEKAKEKPKEEKPNKENEISVLVVDYDMPKVDGINFCKTVNKINSNIFCRSITMTLFFNLTIIITYRYK